MRRISDGRYGLQVLVFAGLLVLIRLDTFAHAAEGDYPVVVKPGDSLSKIGWAATGIKERYIWVEIAEYNNLDPQQPLKVGSTLLIPSRLIGSRPSQKTQVNWTVLGEQAEGRSVSDNENTDEPDSNAVVESDTAIDNDAALENPVSEIQFSETVYSESQSLEAAQSKEGNSDTEQTCGDTEVCVNETIEVIEPVGNTDLQADDVDSSSSDDELVSPSSDAGNDTPGQANANPAIEETVEVETENLVGEQGAVPEDADLPQTVQQQVPPVQEQPVAPPPMPGLFDVDEDAAVRALERSLVQLNALLLSRGATEISFDYTYAYDSVLVPVLVTDSGDDENNAADSADVIAIFEDVNSQHFLAFGIKYGLPGDSQISLSVPFEILESDSVGRVGGVSVNSESQSLSDVGDYSIGFTKALFYEKGRLPDVLLNVSYDGDSGRQSGPQRTGTGADEITVGVNLTKRQDPLVFTFAASHSVSETVDEFKAGSVSRLSVGTLLAASPYTSLQFEFDQVFVNESEFDGASLADTDTTIGSFSIGASSVISQAAFLSAGLRFGLTEAATDYQFSLGLSLQFD